MSDALPIIRLCWHDGHGTATRDGRTAVLKAAPNLGRGPVAQIDYAPGLRCYQIRRAPWDKLDENMTPLERERADALILFLLP